MRASGAIRLPHPQARFRHGPGMQQATTRPRNARTSARGPAGGATPPAGEATHRLLLVLLASLAVALAGCAGGGAGVPSGAVPDDLGGVPDDLGGTPSDDFIPTFPPDDLVSGTAACIDAPTMAIIDQLRAPDADVEAILIANGDALTDGLDDLESADPRTVEWRDALLSALAANDMTAAAAQVAVLVADDLTITPC